MVLGRVDHAVAGLTLFRGNPFKANMPLILQGFQIPVLNGEQRKLVTTFESNPRVCFASVSRIARQSQQQSARLTSSRRQQSAEDLKFTVPFASQSRLYSVEDTPFVNSLSRPGYA